MVNDDSASSNISNKQQHNPFHPFSNSSKDDNGTHPSLAPSSDPLQQQIAPTSSSTEQSVNDSSGELSQQPRNNYQNDSGSDSALREISSKMMSYSNPYMPTSEYGSTTFGSNTESIKPGLAGSQHSTYLSKKPKSRSSTGKCLIKSISVLQQ